MTRVERFRALKGHAWLGRVYAKLSKADIQIGEELLAKHESSSKDELATVILRLWLDKEKPRRWVELEELMIAVL